MNLPFTIREELDFDVEEMEALARFFTKCYKKFCKNYHQT